MKAHSDGAADSLIFPGVSGRPLNGTTLIKALRRATGTDADVHGFRSSFRTWAAERSGATRDVAELALAHVVGGAVERSYARSAYFGEVEHAFRDVEHAFRRSGTLVGAQRR